MIEKDNLKIDTMCLYCTHQIGKYVLPIIAHRKEGSDIVKFKILDKLDFFLFIFIDMNAVIDDINKELRIMGEDIAVTDYRVDRDSNMITFEIA